MDTLAKILADAKASRQAALDGISALEAGAPVDPPFTREQAISILRENIIGLSRTISQLGGDDA